MVPKKVGDELRRRRVTLRLKQADVARAIGTTRAYVSMVERGVDWDPDADKLVAWAKSLSWPEDAILRKLNRINAPPGAESHLAPEVVQAISEVVAAGIRDGFEEVLRSMSDGSALPDNEDIKKSARGSASN